MALSFNLLDSYVCYFISCGIFNLFYEFII